MSKSLNEALKSKQRANIKTPPSLVYKTINTLQIKKKTSGMITPACKQQFYRPKSSAAELSHKQALVSGGMSSSHSNKNFFQSQKLSPKVSIGDIRQYLDPKKKGTNSPSKQKRKASRNSNEDNKVKEEIKKSLAHVINIYYPEHKNSPLDVSLTGGTEDPPADQSEILISKTDFNFIEVIGRGGYGKVWKVQLRKTRKYFAMKEMSKAAIIMKKSVEGVQNERKLLAKLHHNFLANMVGAFHDRETLYLLMDLMPGGDLRYHIGQQKQFSQEQTRFFVACIIIALQFLHSKQIIHRDIKPENLVLDSNGYVRITDLGIARAERDENDRDTSGTPGYMAPEVLCKQTHTYSVDYFALGVIAYQFMLGRRPYNGKSRNQIREAILAKQVQIKKSEIPPGWSLEAADFINKLIQRQPKNRLGHNTGIQQMKQHPWLKKYQWKKLVEKQLKAPFVPQCSQFVLEEDQDEYSESLMQYKILERLEDYKDLFIDYYHRSPQL